MGTRTGAHPLFDVHTDEGRQGLFSFVSDGLPWRLVSIAAQSALSIQAVVEEAGGGHRLLRLDVEPEPPHRITLAATPPLLQDDDGGRSASSTARSSLVSGQATCCGMSSRSSSTTSPSDLFRTRSPKARGACDGWTNGWRTIDDRGPQSLRGRRALRPIGRGTTEYVLLGAGLDSFAYRHPNGARFARSLKSTNLRVSSTSERVWQRRASQSRSSLTFVGVDFENERLDERLAAAGFDLDVGGLLRMAGSRVLPRH